MDSLLQDIRYGIRMLFKTPAVSIVALLSLALGIGANTAIFSIVNTVLLRPLPYPQPERLVKVWGKFDKLGIPKNWISEPEYWDLRARQKSFSSFAIYSAQNGLNLTRGGSDPLRISTCFTSSQLFDVLGVKPVRGRGFVDGEDAPGKEREVVISDKLWRNYFGSDPQLVGKTIELNTQAFTVIGIMPPGFGFAGQHDAWVPQPLDRAKPDDRGNHNYELVARLNPGVTPQQAGEEIHALAAQMAAENPQNYDVQQSGFGMFITPLRTEVIGDSRLPLLVLLGAVVSVLLIACGNIANLLLARGSAREREVAVRTALGAGKLRIVRQLLTESVLLSLAGGLLGILIGWWGLEGVKKFASETLPRVQETSLDGRVLLFCFVISLLTGILFGIAPAVHIVKGNIQESLKEGARGSAGKSRQKLRNVLVVSEIALALVLLVSAGLLLRSLNRLLQVNPGFATQRVLTVQLALPFQKYKDPAVISFYEELMRRLSALPGVEAAGAISHLPMSGAYYSGGTRIENTTANIPRSPRDGTPLIEVDQRMVTPGYLQAMRIPVVRGRWFNEGDTQNSTPVSVVDTEFADRIWPGQDPIGQRVAVGFDGDGPNAKPLWRTVVGVVGHVRHYGLEEVGREQIYHPAAQTPRNAMFLTVRTAADPDAMADSIRKVVASLDPSLPLYEMKTMDEWLDSSMASRKLNVTLLTVFAGVALLMALIGIYGVISYSVVTRTHEIGIRLALGAQRTDVARMVLAHGFKILVLGLAIGTLAAVALSRAMSSLLFGIRAVDPITFLAIPVLLTGVAMLASYLPARRATRVDPMIALRYE
jgi:predicted permease